MGSEQEQTLVGYWSTFSCWSKARLQRFISFAKRISTHIYIGNFFSFSSDFFLFSAVQWLSWEVEDQAVLVWLGNNILAYRKSIRPSNPTVNLQILYQKIAKICHLRVCKERNSW